MLPRPKIPYSDPRPSVFPPNLNVAERKLSFCHFHGTQQGVNTSSPGNTSLRQVLLQGLKGKKPDRLGSGVCFWITARARALASGFQDDPEEQDATPRQLDQESSVTLIVQAASLEQHFHWA